MDKNCGECKHCKRVGERRWEESHHAVSITHELCTTSIRKGKGGAHLGINNPLAKVHEQFYWLHYREDVEKWCSKCETCATTEGPTPLKRRVEQYNVGICCQRRRAISCNSRQ